MPIYEFRCDRCGHVTEALRSVDSRNNVPECEECSGRTQKIISSYSVHGDLDYYDDNLETHITSKQQRKKVMKEKGVSEYYGKGWT